MVLIMSPEMEVAPPEAISGDGVHISLQEHHRVVLIKRSFETRRRIIAIFIIIIGFIVFPLIIVVADLYNFFFPNSFLTFSYFLITLVNSDFDSCFHISCVLLLQN